MKVYMIKGIKGHGCEREEKILYVGNDLNGGKDFTYWKNLGYDIVERQTWIRGRMCKKDSLEKGSWLTRYDELLEIKIKINKLEEELKQFYW